MKETDKFIVRICCEPQIKIVDDDGMASFNQKIVTMRVEKIDEGIIGQLREIMRLKGITELFAIDESKVLQLVKEHKALEIIKNKYLSPHDFVLCYYTMNNKKWIDYEEYKKAYLNYYENDEYMLTQEEYELLKEVLL